MTKKVKLDRAAFFAALRKDDSGVFNRRLSQPQVDGVEAILDSAARHAVFDVNHVANILAQVYHETGTYMLGIKETVMPSHTNKRPADATVKSRLEKAWKDGKLSWVTNPYWREGWFGRGPVQITHRGNYEKMGRILGVDLVGNPDLALDPKVGADIAVVGMSEGLFTGKKLGHYDFPIDLDNGPGKNPRRIVNGQDGTDTKIAGYHRGFVKALRAGGYAVVDELIVTGSISADKIKANSITAVAQSPNLDKLAGATAELVTPPNLWASLFNIVLKIVGARRV